MPESCGLRRNLPWKSSVTEKARHSGVLNNVLAQPITTLAMPTGFKDARATRLTVGAKPDNSAPAPRHRNSGRPGSSPDFRRICSEGDALLRLVRRAEEAWRRLEEESAIAGQQMQMRQRKQLPAVVGGGWL